MLRRTKLVYGVLLAVWGVVLAWQILEHGRVKASARTALINRSKDITTTLGLVIRSQRRWGGISQARIESALKELVKSDELSSVALLNASGEIVASAGGPIDLGGKGMMQAGEHWDARHVTLVNLVDLGASVTPEGETNRPIIVFPRREAGAPPRFEPPPVEPASASGSSPRRGPSPPDGPHEDDRPRPRFEAEAPGGTSNGLSGPPGVTANLARRGPGNPRSGRPPWMT